MIIQIALVFCCLVGLNAEPIVTISDGQISGQELKTFTNLSFYAYQGIPFAKPPLGTLRFQAPQPPEKWTAILNATDESDICYQQGSDSPRENEDCLYINVYTPVGNSENTTKLPVVFWIYGGGFRAGATSYAGNRPEYFMDEGVVLVAANYRVGPFGFLSTGDMVIPGNAGLKDQNLALQWTKQNIEQFGGDPEKITIFGQSAGAASVGYHLLSKLSSGLFRGGIADSGSPLDTYTFLDKPMEYALEIAQLVDSNFSLTADTAELADFLQSADARAIDSASTQTTFSQAGITVEPEHEGAFLTGKMYELLVSGNVNPVPILMGINSEERIELAKNVSDLKHRADIYDSYPEKLVPDYFPTDANLTLVGEDIMKIYVNDSFADHLGRVVRYDSDNRYNRGVLKQAELLSTLTDVYFYQFSYDGVLAGINVTIDDAEKVAHAAELRYIFTSRPLDQLTDSDALTHRRMIKMWLDFAKYLNPTPSKVDLLQNVTWPTVSPTNYQYLDIGNDLVVKTGPKGEFYRGWVNVFEKYGVRPFTTY